MDVEGRLRTMIDVFRRECHKVLQSERVTVHSADSMLMVLQLAMAEVNKQGRGEFEVALSDVLVAWRYLLLDKLRLPVNEVIRPENYDLILQEYQSFLKRSNTLDLVDVHALCSQLGVHTAAAGDSLDPVQLFEFLSAKEDDPSLMEAAVPSTPTSQRGSSYSKQQIKTEVRGVFLSYLSLLVNSKDDLALARVLDIPGRTLGRAAFTDLRHAARRANTSLFLAGTSFVRAIQLGGKGYAPAESDPLRRHLKGLSDFVQFVDNLEEIVGETPDPCACGGRLMAAIRAALVKGRGGEDEACAAAEDTARDLRERIGQLHLRRQGGAAADATGSGISPARPRAHAINHATALGGRDTVKVLTLLLDQEALAPPCRNKARLLAQDPLSGLGGGAGAAMLTLFRSPEAVAGDSPKPLKTRVQSRQGLLKPKVRPAGPCSQFACTYRDGEPPLNRALDFPSSSQLPTCVHPGPMRAAAVLSEEGPGSAPNAGPPAPCDPSAPPTAPALQPRQRRPNGAGAPGKAAAGTKRKQADTENQRGDAENRPPAKRAPAAPGRAPAKSGPKGPSSKRRLIAGQGTLTGFFRV